MRKNSTRTAPEPIEINESQQRRIDELPGVCDVKVSVSLDLTANELDTLVDLCAENNLFRFGIRLAERKARLLANAHRMRRDMVLEIQAHP